MQSGDAVEGDTGTLLSFEPRTGPAGVDVVDHIERRRCSLYMPESVAPRQASTDAFYFPVDRGVSVTTERFTLPHTAAACVRNHSGFMIDELTQGDARDFPSDLYSIELSAPVKLYIVVEAAPTVSVTTEEVTISFDRPVEVRIGARSHHKHPAATIETTSDPDDMMEAVSYLGSALKTTSVERSYPTLRGHPPTIELADSQRIPGILRKPETGVTIELPPDHESIFVASTLAYYLGADVTPAGSARIITETGFVHELSGTARGFEGEVERVLKQVFFLDCVTRTEGFYPVNLHERNQIEDAVGLDFEFLYDQPIDRQLEFYLDVPFSLVEPHVPQWKLTAHVTSVPKHVELLPFVVNDLAVLKSADPNKADQSAAQVSAVEEFMRNESFTRSSGTRASADSPPKPQVFDVEETDSLDQTWIGNGAPMGASKAMLEAYQNRLKRKPKNGNIEITVVCNDSEMSGERDVVDNVYGSRENLPFDVDLYRDLSKNRLKSVLESDMDFLHYIGHIECNGFECKDGYFDAEKLDVSGADAFFLNACSSYDQGKRLIESGSICGIVTLQEVINSGAERVGMTFAKLLNCGFPFNTAIKIAKQQSIMGGHYLALGDGSLDVVQSQSGNPIYCHISKSVDNYNLSYITYPARGGELGAIHYPFISSNNEYYLVSGMADTFKVDEESLVEFLHSENTPVEISGDLKWSSEIETEEEFSIMDR